MARRIIYILLFLVSIPAIASGTERIDSVAHRIKNNVHNYLHDSVPTRLSNKIPENKSWIKQLVDNRFNVMDTTLKCPRFVEMCLDVYRWGDHTFNSYDSSYVYSCPQKWKVMIKANTKWDMYDFDARNGSPSLFINTEPRTSAGFRLSFMAVGFEYMPDIDNLLSGRVIDHRRTRFSFTCSRIVAELYYNKNTGTSRINKFGSYEDGRFVNVKFDGLTSKTFGIDAFYVFNHKKYAHAAAYCFSKIQRRSAGSFILGVQYTNQKLSLDTSKLPEDLKPFNPWPNENFSFHFYDYAINVGYGYNWVFRNNWLFNVTAMPSVGVKHCVDDTFDGPTNKLALNIRGRFALVRNAGRFFYGLHASFNGYTSWGKSYWFYNQIGDVTAIAGFRF